MEIPEGYTLIPRGPGAAIVLRREAPSIAEALSGAPGREPVSSEGRGITYRFPLRDGAGIVRPYRRGGAMARLWGDRYLLVNRPLLEFRIHLRCYRAGLPVPEPLGAAWNRSGLWLRGAFATRELEAVTLQRYLEAGTAEAEVLRRVGACVATLHRHGVWHADLQVRNVLITPAGEPYLIDFDKAVRVRILSGRRRRANLARLARSFDKNALPRAAYESIREGYRVAILTA